MLLQALQRVHGGRVARIQWLWHLFAPLSETLWHRVALLGDLRQLQLAGQICSLALHLPTVQPTTISCVLDSAVAPLTYAQLRLTLRCSQLPVLSATCSLSFAFMLDFLETWGMLAVPREHYTLQDRGLESLDVASEARAVEPTAQVGSGEVVDRGEHGARYVDIDLFSVRLQRSRPLEHLVVEHHDRVPLRDRLTGLVVDPRQKLVACWLPGQVAQLKRV